MLQNEALVRIVVWNECYISGGADWSLIDLVTSWPDEKDVFVIYVNRTHEGLDLIRAKTAGRAEVRTFTSVAEFLSGITRVFPDRLKRPARALLFPAAIALSFIRYWPLVKRRTCDAIVFNNGGFPGGLSNYLAAVAAMLKGIAGRVMIIRNYPHQESRFLSMARGLCNSGVIGTVIAVSESLKRSLIDEAGIGAERVKRIYNGISVEGKNGDNAHPVLVRKNGPCAGIIGTLEERKGHRVLFMAWREVLKTFPEATLYVVGSSKSGDKGGLVEFARALGIERGVAWLEFERNIGKVYSALDVVALASREYESFGRVVVEAFAFKRPVVASRVGGVPELIEDGVDGFLFQKDCHAELAVMIVRLFSSKELCEGVAESGFRKYKSRFTAAVMAKNYHEMLAIYGSAKRDKAVCPDGEEAFL